MKYQLCNILARLVVSDLKHKQRLTAHLDLNLDGELRHYRARPKYITMHCDVATKDLGEDPPVLQLPDQRLILRPQPPLRRLLLRRIHVISRAFHLIRVAEVALVSLDPITRLKEVHEDFLKNFNVRILTTGRVGTLDPRRAPCEDVNAQLVAQGGLPRS